MPHARAGALSKPLHDDAALQVARPSNKPEAPDLHKAAARATRSSQIQAQRDDEPSCVRHAL